MHKDKMNQLLVDMDYFLAKEVKESDTFKFIINLINIQIHNMEMAVLNFDLNKPFANLALEKAKADGAKLLLTKLLSEVDRLVASNTRS